MNVKEYIKNCQLVVHSGGKGERWSSITKNEIVKPMTEIGLNPRPMFDWSILPFVKSGIQNIYPTLWFKSDSLKQHAYNISENTNLNFIYLEEKEKRIGRAGIIKESIKNGLLDPKKPIISINGSDIISIDVEKLIKFHIEGVENGFYVTVVGATEIPTEFGQYKIDPKTNVVSCFKEKPVVKISKYENVHTGIFVFDSNAINFFDKIDEKSYPINIEDLKGEASNCIFNNARSYSGIIPLKEWVFFKNPKNYKDFRKIDFENFLKVENVENYLGKYNRNNEYI